MDAKQKRELQVELRSKGYSWNYLDTWQPKVDMWWHRPQLNTEGQEVWPAGTLVPNQPGHPDHQARLSRRGLLPWPPSEGCRCKGCRDRFGAPDFNPPVNGNGSGKVLPAHIHKYKGKTVGSPCRTGSCPGTRQTPYAKRAAAVPMQAEAAV